MSPNVLLEIAELQDKTVSQLVQRYEQVFEEECRSRNKQYLIRRIAWRLQANEEGGLSRAALKKAEELAIGAETRVTAPRKFSTEGVKLVLQSLIRLSIGTRDYRRQKTSSSGYTRAR
jgi:hypothetical protein